MLRFSTNNDRDELKKLYNICFPGESDFCSRYFEFVYPKTKCIVFDNGSIVAMAHLIDIEIEAYENVFKGAYLYAVATLPEFRGRGIAANILKFAENHCIGNGYDFLCLIPQKESLFEFYKKFGFEKGLYVSNARLNILECEASGFSVVKSSDYTAALKIYNSNPCLKLTRSADDFLKIQRVYNTEFYYFVNEGELPAYLLGEADGDVFEAYEAVGSEQNIKTLTALVAKQNCCTSAVVTTAPNVFNEAVLGSVKPLTKEAEKLFETKKVYANLLFN